MLLYSVSEPIIALQCNAQSQTEQDCPIYVKTKIFNYFWSQEGRRSKEQQWFSKQILFWILREIWYVSWYQNCLSNRLRNFRSCIMVISEFLVSIYVQNFLKLILNIHYGPSIMSQKEASRKPPGSPRRGIPGGFLSKLLKSPVFPANFKKEVR